MRQFNFFCLVLPFFLCCEPALASQSLGYGDARSYLKAARRNADQIAKSTDSTGISLIGRIAQEQYRAGDHEGALDGARVVLELFHRRGDCAEHPSLTGLAKAQWENGNFAEASGTMKALLEAGRSLDRKTREYCLGPLAVLQAELGNLEAAKAIAAEIPGVRKSDILPDIAILMARRGLMEEAVALADSASPTWGDRAIHEVISIRMEGTQWKEAGAVREKLGFRSTDNLLSWAAVKAALGGDFERAIILVGKVKDRDEALFAWGSIVISRARHGSVTDGVKEAKARLAAHPHRLAGALMEIARIQRQAGDSAGSEQTRMAALQACAKCDPEYLIRHQLPWLARSGRKEDFLSLAEGLKFGKDSSFSETSQDLAKTGDMDAAAWVAGMVREGEYSEKTYAALASAQIRHGDLPAALLSVEAMGGSAFGERVELLRRIVVEQARRDDIRGALETVDRLDSDIYWERHGALEEIAQVQMEAEDFPSAPAWISGLKDPEEKAHAWLGAARGLRLRGEGRPGRK